MMKGLEDWNIENKETKKFSDLTIITSTFYGPDHVAQMRQKLAEKFLENCYNLNINCVVVDGGSNQAFIDKIKSLENVTLVIKLSATMGESRREALRLAMEKYGTPYYLWAEPEKNSLIEDTFLESMIVNLREGLVDIIVPERATLDSYPEQQAWLEKRANKRATKIMNPALGKSLDLWFGPKMFNQAGAKYFTEYKTDLDKWDWAVGPVINAYKDGLRVMPVEVDYQVDASQKETEESDKVTKKKRLKQYVSTLQELGDPAWPKDKSLKGKTDK